MNLSSVLAQLVVPLNLCAALLLLALLFFIIRWRKLAFSTALSGLLWVGLWSTPAFNILAGSYLEQRYPYVAPANLAQADAIVVLGGHTAQNRSNWFLPDSASRTSSRVRMAADIYHAGRAPIIILSGAALDGGVSEAQMMTHTLTQFNVPASATLQEEQSLTTEGNGFYSAQLLREHQLRHVLLVTSALHMPRAMAVFKKQGVDVVAAPAPPQIVAPTDTSFSLWLPNIHTLQSSRSIIKEYLGMTIYWVRGWI